MQIRDHGKFFKKKQVKKTEEFTCNSCGCRFVCDEDEYYKDSNGGNNWNDSLTISVSSTPVEYLVCSCPECHKIIKKTRHKEISAYGPYVVPVSVSRQATYTSEPIDTQKIEITTNESSKGE